MYSNEPFWFVLVIQSLTFFLFLHNLKSLWYRTIPLDYYRTISIFPYKSFFLPRIYTYFCARSLRIFSILLLPCRGCHTICPFKCPSEGCRTAVAYHFRYLFQIKISLCNQPFCFFQTNSLQITAKGFSHCFLKEKRKITFRQAKGCCRHPNTELRICIIVFYVFL